ncbi:MAG: macrolide ABC transporter ATP-binding protein, partial [Bacteroidetes bacterium]|nr:macrolide ABC transporter ATP-binding protein [Bacteroidota bacterium]
TSLEVMDILQEVNTAGITVIIVTHEHDIAMRTKKTIRITDGNITEVVEN